MADDSVRSGYLGGSGPPPLPRVVLVSAVWSSGVGDDGLVERGGDVDLSVMPVDAVAACRRAWAALVGTPEAVVHGDPGPANIRITAAGVGLLDWDEARLDSSDLDLAGLPVSALPPDRLAVAGTAATAWEAANGWTVEPPYARRQLALLRAGKHNFDRTRSPDTL